MVANPFRVMIDPAHGGKYPGGIGPSGLTEAAVNLNVGLLLAKNMVYCGYEVYLTRRTDKWVTNKERAYMANDVGADVLVTIHHFWHEDPTRNGTKVTYYPRRKYKKQSRLLADAIYGHVCRCVGQEKLGVNEKVDKVTLTRTLAPACIVEASYISNPQQERLLSDPTYLQGEAQAIADGINDYLRLERQASL